MLAGIAAAGSTRAVLDLAGVGFLCSAALQALVDGQRQLAAQPGGTLVLCGTSPRLTALVRLTRLDTLLPVYPDSTSAADALQAPVRVPA